MKITHVAGSPRKHSSSTKIAVKFCDTAAQNGAEVSSHILNKMDFNGCQGCYGCKVDNGTCVLKDDLKPVLKEIEETDVLVISVPVYLMDIPGQAKCFMDRLYSFMKPNYASEARPSKLPEGKKLVFIQTSGAEESWVKNIPERYQQVLEFFGFPDVETILASGLKDPNKAIEPEIYNKAEKLALSYMNA